MMMVGAKSLFLVVKGLLSDRCQIHYWRHHLLPPCVHLSAFKSIFASIAYAWIYAYSCWFDSFIRLYISINICLPMLEVCVCLPLLKVFICLLLLEGLFFVLVLVCL
ncbi:hypothetical protein Sjap_015571 [Stephania japonica]|uniref:Uncharacterized protein n=1 Tax=Stephania japonica TaxID=461633 RepID=A0AAP0IJD7_9MAGN